MFNVVYNPQKPTSYRVFDLLYSKQTRRKDRILGHCMAARSHRLQRARGRGHKSEETRNKNTHSTFPFPKALSSPTRNSASFHHSCTHFQSVITKEVEALSNAQLIRAVHLFECVIPSETNALFNVQFHLNPQSLQQPV